MPRGGAGMGQLPTTPTPSVKSRQALVHEKAHASHHQQQQHRHTARSPALIHTRIYTSRTSSCVNLCAGGSGPSRFRRAPQKECDESLVVHNLEHLPTRPSRSHMRCSLSLTPSVSGRSAHCGCAPGRPDELTTIISTTSQVRQKCHVKLWDFCSATKGPGTEQHKLILHVAQCKAFSPHCPATAHLKFPNPTHSHWCLLLVGASINRLLAQKMALVSLRTGGCKPSGMGQRRPPPAASCRPRVVVAPAPRRGCAARYGWGSDTAFAV